jgi:hypothetical protein
MACSSFQWLWTKYRFTFFTSERLTIFRMTVTIPRVSTNVYLVVDVSILRV